MLRRMERSDTEMRTPLNEGSLTVESSSVDSQHSLSSLEDAEQNVIESINPHRSLTYIIILTLVIGGLQLSWSAEFSEGTPFLLSLGVSKRALALVWIAGPLSGTIGQPIVGILSDNCQWRYGRRRPFIIFGGLAVALSLLYLSWSTYFISFFISDTERIKSSTIPFAVVGVYVLDFSISAIQAAGRAFIVDNVPTHQQQVANAWAARMTGLFNIIGFFLGTINLTRILGFLGNTQFRVLSACAVIALVITITISCVCIRERDPTVDPTIKYERKIFEMRVKKLNLPISTTTGKLRWYQNLQVLFYQTWHSIKRLPPQAKLICKIQFFAWIGYFPMLFYTSTFVGELYKKQFFESRDPSLPPLDEAQMDLLDEDATRKGSEALLLHAIVTLATNILLPHIVRPTLLEKGAVTGKFVWQWLTVGRAWTIGHLVFALATISTFLVTGPSSAIAMITFLGIPWGIALWAPFVLISEEISQIKELKAQELAVGDAATGKYAQYEHEAGVILGIHNVFVSSPQMISSLCSSLIFHLLSSSDSSKQFVYDSSIAWVFRFGGVCSLFAFYFSFGIKTTEQLLQEYSYDRLPS